MRTAFLIPLVVLAVILAGTTSAKAAIDGIGLFVEPGVTYERGNTRTDWPSVLNDSTGESNGLGLMGRLGVHFVDIVFVGLDGRYSMPSFKDSSVNYSADATQFNWGPVVGVQTPVLGLRVWGGYVVGGWLDPKASGSLDVKLEDAEGYRVGAGFRVLMLSVNLEYQQLKYGKVNVENAGGFSFGSFDSVKPKNDSWIVSVSFPFDL
jgi:hypothetical protein